jgi:hypothetical protein
MVLPSDDPRLVHRPPPQLYGGDVGGGGSRAAHSMTPLKAVSRENIKGKRSGGSSNGEDGDLELVARVTATHGSCAPDERLT